MLKISVDSNILIYAEGTDDLAKRDIVIPIIGRIGSDSLLLTLQAAGETLRWLVVRGKLDKHVAMAKMQFWFSQATLLPMTISSFKMASQIMDQHSFQLWDAVILAGSAEVDADIAARSAEG